MVRAARSGGRSEAGPAKERKVEPWDVRRAGQIGREQLQAITHLHAGLLGSSSHALGGLLRVVDRRLVSPSISATVNFWSAFRRPPISPPANWNHGHDGGAATGLESGVSHCRSPAGKGGQNHRATREITEIEEQIVESVARIVCREFGRAWQAVNLEVGFEQRLDPAEAQHLMPPHEKILSLSFEITMTDVRGGLNLAVPVSVSHALLRKISGQLVERRARGRNEWREGVKRRLLECPFAAELGVNDLRASVGALSQLVAGQLLPLGRSAAQPAALLLAGVEIFRAMPVRAGDTRAAQMVARSGEGDGVSTEIPASKNGSSEKEKTQP